MSSDLPPGLAYARRHCAAPALEVVRLPPTLVDDDQEDDDLDGHQLTFPFSAHYPTARANNVSEGAGTLPLDRTMHK